MFQNQKRTQHQLSLNTLKQNKHMTRNIHKEALYVFDHNNHATIPQSNHSNMRYGIIHGAFFQMATAFADPYTIIPLFLTAFTDSRMLIGLIVSLFGAIGTFPQILTANQLILRPHIAKPLMLAGIWTRCAVWGIIATITLIVSTSGTLMLGLFILGISIYSLGGGLAVLPFKQVISETITPQQRSSFFGWRLLSGGVLAIFAGIIVKYTLETGKLEWPQNYGILFFFSFIALVIAYTAMSHLQFPKKEAQKIEPHTTLTYELRKIWQEYPILKRLIFARLLSGGLVLTLPFLILYATQTVEIQIAWAGFFIIAQRMGSILSNLVWIPLGNRMGTRLVIISGQVLAILGLGTILLASNAITLTIAFALAGGAMSAMAVGFNGYIMEIGKSETRPILFAIEGTLLIPLCFMPLLGGLIADVYGYKTLTILGICLVFTSLLMASTLCEPRRKDALCGPCNAFTNTL